MNATISKKTLLRGLVIGSILGALVMATLAFYGDTQALATLGHHYPWFCFIGGCGLALANYLFRYMRWSVYLHALDIHIPTGTSMLIFVAGFAMSITPGKMGEVLKSAMLAQRFGIAIKRSAPIVVAERLNDFLALLLLMSLGALFFPGAWLLAPLGMLAFFALALLGHPSTARNLVQHLHNWTWSRGITQKATPLLESFWQLGHMRTFAKALLLSTLGWAMEVLAFAWIATGLHAPVTLLEGAFVFGASTLGGALSFLPAGLGPTELGFHALLEKIGTPQDHAAFITILTRMATLWLAVVLGVLALIIFALTKPKHFESTPSEHTG